jgi:hypothetical protein
MAARGAHTLYARSPIRSYVRRTGAGDRISSLQAIELPAVSSNPETSPVCQDWMVGDAGIEPATPPV